MNDLATFCLVLLGSAILISLAYIRGAKRR